MLAGRWLGLLVGCWVAVAMGCGGDDGVGPGGMDAGRSDGGGGDGADLCVSHDDCDDGAFCNGAERCEPGGGSADARGCVAASSPCGATAECDEVADMCPAGCPDEDRDGHMSDACGGDDCDDADVSSFPGNAEVCDSDGRDEDCDPMTLGVDADADGFPSDECCNEQPGGSLTCGRDCDDTLSGVNPGAPDGCGGGDENCNGMIDDDPDSTFFRDQDGDNWGVETDTVQACALPMGYSPRSGDCVDDPFMNPDAANISPGETELCNLRDDDCDGAPDDGLTCDCTMPGMSRSCGVDPTLDGVGICRLGTQMCLASGMWSACAGAVAPMMETCNLQDDDCDRMVDDGVRVRCWTDADSDGYAALGASSIDVCAPCPLMTTMRDPSLRGADCQDGNAMIYPGATELCDRIDSNCTSTGGVEAAEDADSDGHTATGYAGCAGGPLPKDDCNDANMLVHPGQTYQRAGICPSGSCYCSANNMCRSGPVACLLGCTGTIAPTWDYNCNGATERQPSSTSSMCPAFCMMGTACLGDDPYYAGTPACGSSVTWLHCGSGGCPCTSTANTSEALGCR